MAGRSRWTRITPWHALPGFLATASPGNVYYAFTHDEGPAGLTVHSIAPNHFGYTHFDLPSMPTGKYTFHTVTNGIRSNAISVSVLP